MIPEEVKNLIEFVKKNKTETQTLEVKEASKGVPSSLYDTLSSFSNQDDGGVILFGVSESNGFLPVGVADVHMLQKKVSEQCEQMSPPVRAVFSVYDDEGKVFLTAEIPAIDISERPCFYKGKGRLKGSWVRVGDADIPMSEYEIYSYEAYRKKYQDDIRVVERASVEDLNKTAIEQYLYLLKKNKPHVAKLEREQILNLMSMTVQEKPTLTAVQLFSPYPQAFAPQLCIVACVVPGREMGDVGESGERFIDNRRIEGTIPEMLEEAMSFVRKNMRTKSYIDTVTGRRIDTFEYPSTAIREVIVNALVHRDYSLYTEGKPIQIVMFEDRMEIRSPGGLYGRLQIDQLGKVQPDTRNPALATALEVLGVTENRYSGIPTVRREFQEAGLPEPEFQDFRKDFCVTLHKKAEGTGMGEGIAKGDIITFCQQPRSRAEIASFLEMRSVTYAYKTYVLPLLAEGSLRMTMPENPKSTKQRFIAVARHD